ncbi:hypothetical protein GOP47_0002151 [Adiantum capillus-veneris]|uniref:DUF4408 domain-containing protein n=1 Tax=Adiantum capillus-veneris TaxID=13818 RepID=A0A9D4VA25_ADICA|nr:hypothetical protein GOP47_0002151 [Adiantum capillus-veneris]
MAQLKSYALPVSALCSTVMASLTLWYSNPDLLSKYIVSILDAFAGFRAWLTPPILFLLMNGVVLSLAFTSGFLKHRQQWRDGEELEDLTQISRRKHHAEAAEAEGGPEAEEEEEREKDEEEDDGFYPEVFSSFFGDGGVTIARRKPVLHRSASAPLAERKGRSFYPSISGSLSQKFSPSPSLLGSTNSPKSVSSQPLLKVLRPAHTVPKPSGFELKKPLTAIRTLNTGVEDKDVDERADAFIGDFYKNLKLQQVDPYVESLERSYGR